MKRKKKINFSWKPDCSLLKRSNPSYMKDYYAVSSYLRTEVDCKELKKHTIKWLKSKKYTIDCRGLEDWRFDVIGKLCYIENNGGEIPETGPKFIENKLKEFSEILEKQQTVVKDEPKIPKPSIQDHLRNQAGDVASEIDGWIDEFIEDPNKFDLKQYDIVKLMRIKECKQGHARYIAKFYQPCLSEVTLALAGTENDVAEAYSHLGKTNLKKLKQFYEKIIEGTEVLISSSKAQKKPRKKKQKDPSKLVEKLKFQKEDLTVGLVSINPVDILGAKILWVYNTKTRKIGRYISFDEAGLSIKGTTLQNFSTDKSLQKTLRKPKDQLKSFKSTTEKKAEKLFTEIGTTETKLNGRLNDQVVVFKAYK